MARPRKEKPNHGKYYEVKMTVGHAMDGSPIRKSFYSEISKDDARRKGNDYITEQKLKDATGVGFSDKNITFGAFATKWLQAIKGTMKGNTYSQNYEIPTRCHLLPYFGKALIADIRQLDIQVYFNSLTDKYTIDYIKKDYSCLRRIYERAIDNGLISSSPVRNIQISSTVPKMEKKVYSTEDIVRVLKYCEIHPHGLEIEILLRLGLRRGELLGIRWQDIDTNAKILYINQAVARVKNQDTGKTEIITDRPKTKYSARPVPLPEDLSKKLETKKAAATGEYLVQGRDPDSAYNPDNWSQTICEGFIRDMIAYYAAQDPPIKMHRLTAHEFRHTCTSALVNGGKNLYAIAAALGWGNLEMLRKRYAHPDIESIRRQLDF